MARRSDHSRDEIREMALAAAEEIVATQGYQALSARKLAAAIGYTVGTLYLVFENLDDLILQVNGRTLDRLSELIMQDQRHCNDAEACLFQLGHSYIRFADSEPHAWQMIFEYHMADDREAPDWLRQKITRMFALVEERLARLAEQHTQAEIAQGARALWGGVHGICILAVNNTLGAAGVESVQAITHALMSNFLKGFVDTPSGKI
ncbi:MAG: TetR/AcrR family transcriptional regulator [Chromatiales bacterium]|jgi:AcrR family transcriptional regulator